MRSDAQCATAMTRALRATLTGMLLAVAAAGSAADAQESATRQPSPPPPAEDAERPEYRTRALPTDTFEPSEQVSEDYAIPFPADI